MTLSKNEMQNILNNNIIIKNKEIPSLISKILSKKALSEIIINEDGKVLIEQNSKLCLEKESLSSSEIERFIDFITYINNKSVGFNKPIFDGTLANGIRVNIISKPVSEKGYIITLRTKSIKNVSLNDLLKIGSINQRILTELETAIEDKKNILIAGGTNTGKTTFINSLLKAMPKKEKILILEDTAEIEYSSPYISKLLTVQHQETGLDISLGDLVKTSLRMRPDRIIVGEIRGQEAYHLLHAMNTGHRGTISSIHANSSRDALRRLEVLSILGQKNLDIFIPRTWISNNIDIVVYMKKEGNKRIVKELVKLEGIEGDTYILEKIN